MTGIRCVLLGVVALLFVSANQANGQCGIWSSAYHYVPTRAYYPWYYYPSYYPAYYYYPPVTVVPVSGQRIIYANPAPAGPSQTGEPPIAQPPMPPAKMSGDLRAPIIVSARASRQELVRVGFWNLSGRDVTLTIEGKSWLLAKDRAITLDVERSFAWQIDQRTQRVERVADAEKTHEVVIRE